ncbi:flagellin [Spirochaetota bacterium]|nr:flagellin [Spirochaetota bacterium]
MKINHNISAVNSTRVLNARNLTIRTGFERVSSGERINRSGDDPASFAVSEKLRTQISSLVSAGKNTNDAISFIQTTEGYLRESQNLLTRIKELAIQAGNGIYSSSDRLHVQKEVSQLVSEINRISSFAEFNGQKILDGRFARGSAESVPLASLYFHVGPDVDQSIRAFISTFNSTALGLENISISSPAKANQAIATIDEALSRVNDQRTDLGAYQNRLGSVLSTTNVTVENFIDAESKIRDADIAQEITDLARDLLVNQANIAMLAQANTNAQSILRLVG